MRLKTIINSLAINTLIGIPIAVVGAASQAETVSETNIETETFTEYLPLYSPAAEPATVAPVQPLYDFIPLPADLQIYVADVAAEYEVNPLLVYAIMWQESRFDQSAVNTAGEHSVGLMQINTYYQGDRMDRLGVTDISDPRQNILVGIDYLTELINWRNDTTLEWALMAYNGGPAYADEQIAKGNVSEYAGAVMDKLLEYAEVEYGY